MNAGGPRFIIRHGVSGIIAEDDEEFCRATVALAVSERVRRDMGSAGCRQVEGQSWDRIFEEVYEGYACPVRIA
jgi:hypothetical protein